MTKRDLRGRTRTRGTLTMDIRPDTLWDAKTTLGAGPSSGLARPSCGAVSSFDHKDLTKPLECAILYW